MNNRKQDDGFEDDLPAFMDLVSHDILNINQSVLSAIELMMASSRADEKSKMHARRVESQIRVSTQIFESMKMLCVLRKGEGLPSDEVDLNDSVRNAVSEVQVMFGEREVDIYRDECSETATVRGGKVVKEVLVNAMMGLIQLDNSEHPRIEVRTSKDGAGEQSVCLISMVDDNVKTPPSLGSETVGALSAERRTRMVKLAGLILARMLTERLGGSFEARPSGKGSEITIKFSGVE